MSGISQGAKKGVGTRLKRRGRGRETEKKIRYETDI
jgi:hypothetical protein